MGNNGEEDYKVVIRSYDGEKDCARVEELERRCEVGPNHRAFLFTDTLGDPICRIRNSPSYTMLVAELGKELAGVIQGAIKVVTIDKPPRDLARVGYVLGLRVCPLRRRAGIGSSLVRSMEEWFRANGAEYAYMATEKDNEASVRLFVHRLGYVQFRTPAILVNPVSSNRHRLRRISSRVEIKKLRIEDAESAYRRFMGSAEFFPSDIENVLRNRLSQGTWVAYYKGEGGEGGTASSATPWNVQSTTLSSGGGRATRNWAMLSVWNSADVFKLRLGNAPLSCMIYTKSSRLMDRFFPCFKAFPSMPDFFDTFGFFFIYGVHGEGPSSGKLTRNLCKFVHNMAATSSKDCKAIVTEVGGCDKIRVHIPHWKLLSCPEDLWCIKALRSEEKSNLQQLTGTPPTRTLFVDPREV